MLSTSTSIWPIAAPASVSLLTDWASLQLASFGMEYAFVCNPGAEKIPCWLSDFALTSVLTYREGLASNLGVAHATCGSGLEPHITLSRVKKEQVCEA